MAYRIGQLLETIHEAIHQKTLHEPLKYSPEADHALLNLRDEISRLEITEYNYNYLLSFLSIEYSEVFNEWAAKKGRIRNAHQLDPNALFSVGKE